MYGEKPTKERVEGRKTKDKSHRVQQDWDWFIYWSGFYDINFFANHFLGHYRVDVDTGLPCKSPPFHKEMLDLFKERGNSLVLVSRSHAKTTNIIISTIHDICYQLESGILFIMQKSLGVQCFIKIRREFESNEEINRIFGVLVPKLNKEEKLNKRRDDFLMFKNGVDIQRIQKHGSVRGARKTKIHVDDPEEDSEMKNPQNTKDLMSWLSGTIVPVTKCINMKITGTVIANHCLVHTMFQTAETFKKMKYTTIQKPEFKTINNRPHLVGGKGFLWEARRGVKELNDQLQSMIDLDPRDGYKIFLREYFHKPFNNNGRPVFPQERVEKLICPEYTVDERYPGLRIYRNEPGEYARGCDTADGGVGGDYSTITIRDRDQRMIASYQGHIISSDYVELLEYMIETYKFEGLIGIEKNRPQVIELAKVRYWNMLLYKIKTIDKITNQISQKYGFATTSQSKPLIIDKTVNKLCDGVKPILEVDDRAKVEMQNYYYDEQGRANAISPNHDDLVMSDMICLHMLDEM